VFLDTVQDKALHEQLHKARRALPSDEPLRHVFRARHRALLTGRRAEEARQTDAAWVEACPAYGEARRASASGDLDLVESHGLRMALPRATSTTGFGARLREGWLPWRDILSQRELGVGTVMIDIGANIGTTSIVRVILGDVQRVYAIEPEPANFACLVHNIVANGLAGFVLPDASAISSRTGPGLLRQASGLGAHRLLDDKAMRRGRRDSLPVPTWTLDDWVAHYGIDVPAVSLIKVDTQGWESHVLAGAARLLSAHHAAWVIEVSPRHLEAAGTPLARLIEQCQAHFTHAIDFRGEGSKARVLPVAQLAEALAYLDASTDATYTNLLLYHAS
jgi:FkbM family methyltransferase